LASRGHLQAWYLLLINLISNFRTFSNLL
jgi:hypothetical protein